MTKISHIATIHRKPKDAYVPELTPSAIDIPADLNGKPIFLDSEKNTPSISHSYVTDVFLRLKNIETFTSPYLFYLRSLGGSGYQGYFFLYPHFGHTPFSFKAMPHKGQRSTVVLTSYF